MAKSKQTKTRAQQVVEAMGHCTSTDDTRRHICKANIVVESDGEVTLQATDGHILLDISHVAWDDLQYYFKREHGFKLPSQPAAGGIFTSNNTRKKTSQFWFVPESEANPFPADTDRVRPEGKNPEDKRPNFSFEILAKVKKIYKSLGMSDMGFIPDKWDDSNAGEKSVDGGFLVVMGYRA